MTTPGSTDRTVTAKLRIDGTQAKAEAAAVASSIKGVEDATKRVGDQGKKTEDQAKRTAAAHKAAWADVGQAATLAGAAVVAGVGAFVYAGAQFDKQMSAVDSVTEATTAQMGQLRQAALQAGKDTVFSATESARAEEELAKAGIGAADVLGGALRGSLDLAAAGSVDLAEAATIAARTMNIFNLGGKDVAHVADVLAAAANKSATDVHQMGESLRMGGLAAKLAGLSLEDTVGTLALFHDNALIGSDAGTSLKTMLTFLAAPSVKAATLMRDLGISAYDASGNFVGVTKLAGILQTQLSGLTQEQRQAALATIFGSDAMRAASILYDTGEQGVRDYVNAVDDQGAAQETAAAKTDNLIGDIERLKGSLETLAIGASSGSTGGLRTLVQTLDNLVGSLSNIPAPVQNTTLMIAGVGGAALLAAGAVTKVGVATSGAMEALTNLGPRGERAATVLGKVGVTAGRAAVALAVLQTASAVIGEGVNVRVQSMAESLAEFGTTGQFAGESARVLGDDMGRLDTALKDIDTGVSSDWARGIAGTIEGLTGLGNVMDDSLQKAMERLDAVDQGLTALVTAGRADEAAAAFNRIAAEGAKFGISVKEIENRLPNYASAVEEAAKSSDKTATAQAAAAKTAAALGNSWSEAASEGKTLTDVFDDLTGAARDWAGTEVNMQAAIDDLTASISENGKTLKASEPAGRANITAMLDLAESTRDAVQAKYDATVATLGETEAMRAANKVFAEGRDALVKAAMAAGETRAKAEALADQWLRMPPLVTTRVETKVDTLVNPSFIGPIAPEVTKRIAAQAASDLQRELSRYQLTPPSIRPVYHAPQRWGGVRYADSGLVGLRDANMFPAGTSPLYGFAEPGTGGEAFVPRFGDRGRSVGILSEAAAWYGQRVVPAGGGWGGPGAGAVSAPVVNVTATVEISRSQIEGIAQVTVRQEGRVIARQIASGQRP